MNINWDLVKSFALKTPILIGLVAGVMAAAGVSAGTMSYIGGIMLAAGALLVGLIDLVRDSRAQTDAGKARVIESLDPAGKAAVLEKLPDRTKIEAVTALKDVKQVVVADNSGDGVGKALQDSLQPKVISVSQS